MNTSTNESGAEDQQVGTESDPTEPVEIHPKKKNTSALLIILIVGMLATAYLLLDKYVLSSDQNSSTTDSEMTESSVFVLTGTLNFRNDNSTTADVITTLHFGDELKLIGEPLSAVVEDDMEVIWHKAVWNDEEGWIAHTIDGQSVVGDEQQKASYEQLFVHPYTEDAEYGIMKVWAYNALIAWLESRAMLGGYAIRDASLDPNSQGLNNIVRLKQTGIEKDKDAPYDYVVLMESNVDKIAVYLRADGPNTGHVVGSVVLEQHIVYLQKKKDGEMVPHYEAGGIKFSKLKKTQVATTDHSGGVTGWFNLSKDAFTWEKARLIETLSVINIISNTGGIDFASEDAWFDFKSGYQPKPENIWYVAAEYGWLKFQAEEMAFDGQNYETMRTLSSEYKNGEFASKNKGQIKMFIDILEKRLVLFVNENGTSPQTFFGLTPGTLVDEYLNYRNTLYDEETEGC